MNRIVLRSLAVALLALLTACASGGLSGSNLRDRVLYDYAGAIRWSQFDSAWEFIDPKYRDAHPLSDLELERFKLIQVTGYQVKGRIDGDDGSLEQVVEIRLVSKYTQAERIISDHQVWRWDAEKKHFWLMSGLPDFTAN